MCNLAVNVYVDIQHVLQHALRGSQLQHDLQLDFNVEFIYGAGINFTLVAEDKLCIRLLSARR